MDKHPERGIPDISRYNDIYRLTHIHYFMVPKTWDRVECGAVMHPILFKIASIEIRYYGVMIAIAFIAGAIIGEREAKRKGFQPGLVYDLLSCLLVAAIIGARLYYVIFSELTWFLSHP